MPTPTGSARFAKVLFKLLVLTMFTSYGSQLLAASKRIFIVRHAEVIYDENSTDPHLTEQGRKRAIELASLMQGKKLTHIFVTDYYRTQETAAPTAKSIDLHPLVENATSALVSVLLSEKIENALVVGHTNTIPEIISGLGVEGGIATLGEEQFDRLFIVTIEDLEHERVALLEEKRYGHQADLSEDRGL